MQTETIEIEKLDHAALTALLAAPLDAEDPVVTLYFRTGGNSGTERAIVLKDLAKNAETAIANDATLDGERRGEARAALARAIAAARDDIERHRRPGTLVAFSWKDRARLFHLGGELADRVATGRTPYTSPLATIIEENERYAVVLVDHAQGRISEYFLGELTSLANVKDRHEHNARAGTGFQQLKANHHHQVVLHRHLEHVAQRLFALHAARPFDRIVLAGLPDTVNKLERALHPWLRERVIAHERWSLDASADEIRRRLAAIEEEVETRGERDLARTIRRHLDTDGLAARGWDEVSRALANGQVGTLVIEEGLSLRGRECPECRVLLPRPQDAHESQPPYVACPRCERPMRTVEDVLDEAAEVALSTGARVVRCSRIRAELATLGGIAAILRFRP